jgi:hypothetical protein
LPSELGNVGQNQGLIKEFRIAAEGPKRKSLTEYRTLIKCYGPGK